MVNEVLSCTSCFFFDCFLCLFFYIIDLQKTVKLVDAAYDYMKSVAEEGGVALFVGTKKQAQEAIKEEATVSQFVNVPPNQRWLTKYCPARVASSLIASCACFFVPTNNATPPSSATLFMHEERC